MSLSVAENVGTDGGDRMLKSPRAPLVSVTCSSNLLRRVQWRKNEKHEAQQLSHWLMFQKSSPGDFFSPLLVVSKRSAWFPQLSSGLRTDKSGKSLAKCPLQYKWETLD